MRIELPGLQLANVGQCVDVLFAFYGSVFVSCDPAFQTVSNRGSSHYIQGLRLLRADRSSQ